ncbi:NTF2 fold immunity protein [Burkholderia lata]|uniref:NTF2 fold immunity protein n=1 Tax=Burkholderia lata (strain ATCC 17760 / DSM 23089 / LMG 22485 / NCIMB 9086 / R18194 / 383) TaxID=482957 RepID=UPI0034A0A459
MFTIFQATGLKNKFRFTLMHKNGVWRIKNKEFINLMINGRDRLCKGGNYGSDGGAIHVRGNRNIWDRTESGCICVVNG